MYIINKFNPFYKKLGKEDLLQNAVVNYAETQHQMIAIPCNTEFRLNNFQRWKSMVLGQKKGTLDLFFPYPNKFYHGLFIELKKEGTKLFKKNGDLLKDDHLQRQLNTINSHLLQGYNARFAVGFDEAKAILDKYAKQK